MYLIATPDRQSEPLTVSSLLRTPRLLATLLVASLLTIVPVATAPTAEAAGKASTSISKWNGTVSAHSTTKSVSCTVKVTSAYKRKVYLQQRTGGKWKTVKGYTTKNVRTASLKVTLPKSAWRGKSTTTWRLYAPATKRAKARATGALNVKYTKPASKSSVSVSTSIRSSTSTVSTVKVVVKAKRKKATSTARIEVNPAGAVSATGKTQVRTVKTRWSTPLQAYVGTAKVSTRVPGPVKLRVKSGKSWKTLATKTPARKSTSLSGWTGSINLGPNTAAVSRRLTVTNAFKRKVYLQTYQGGAWKTVSTRTTPDATKATFEVSLPANVWQVESGTTSWRIYAPATAHAAARATGTLAVKYTKPAPQPEPAPEPEPEPTRDPMPTTPPVTDPPPSNDSPVPLVYQTPTNPAPPAGVTVVSATGFLTELNAHRKANGVAPLKPLPVVMQFGDHAVAGQGGHAQYWANKTARASLDGNWVGQVHSTSKERSAFWRGLFGGVGVGSCGEVMSYGANKTGPSAIAGWKASSAHNANMLDPEYSHVAIGLADNGGRRFATMQLCYSPQLLP